MGTRESGWVTGSSNGNEKSIRGVLMPVMLGVGMLDAGTPAYRGRSLRVVTSLPSMKNFWLLGLVRNICANEEESKCNEERGGGGEERVHENKWVCEVRVCSVHVSSLLPRTRLFRQGWAS